MTQVRFIDLWDFMQTFDVGFVLLVMTNLAELKEHVLDQQEPFDVLAPRKGITLATVQFDSIMHQIRKLGEQLDKVGAPLT